MGKIIAVVSGKGGAGKTTVTANISAALAAYESKVLVIDMDRGMRNLDLMLGMQDTHVDCSIEDALMGICNSEDSVVVTHPYIDNLYYATANHHPLESIDPEKIINLFAFFTGQFDYIFIDSPSGIGNEFRIAVSLASESIVVINPDIASLHDADLTLSEISTVNQNNTPHIVINRYDNRLASSKHYFTEQDIARLLALRQSDIIGIIPFDKQFVIAENAGKLFISMFPKSLTAIAVFNTAKRIMGARIPFDKRITNKRFSFIGLLKNI